MARPVGMERRKRGGAQEEGGFEVAGVDDGSGVGVEIEGRHLKQEHRSKGRVGKTRLNVAEDTNNSVF